MMKTCDELWLQMLEAGLVQGALPPQDSSSPWFVRLMLGVAGWIGGLFVLGFLIGIMAGLVRDEGAALVVGALACMVAWFVFRSSRDNDFLSQFGLAVCFAGQLLICFGLFHDFRGYGSGPFLALAVCEAALVLLLDNGILRVFSSWVAVLSLAAVLAMHGLLSLTPPLVFAGLAFLWFKEFMFAHWGRILRPCGYGLVVAMMCVNSGALLREFFWLPDLTRRSQAILWPVPWWLGSALTGIVFLAAVYWLLRRSGADFSQRNPQFLLFAALLLSLLCFKAPGVLVGLFVVLVGFAHANRVLSGLGTLSLLIYLSHFYYQLHATLLIKGLSLIAIGLFMLVVRLLLHRCCDTTRKEEVYHA